LSRAITERRRMFTLSRDIQLVSSRVKSDVRVASNFSLLAAFPSVSVSFSQQSKGSKLYAQPLWRVPDS
jgi:hypothetical protein